jgi:hypothetical protein
MGNPVAILAINNLRPFVGLKNAEDAYTDGDPPPVLKKIDRIREHIKNIDSHLLKTLGMAKVPLAYVVRATEVVPPSAGDPSNDYDTIQEKKVARMPHTHIAFREDNIKVWEIIRDSLHATEAFNWIKRSERRRDGRSAYLALTTHYLGASKNETLRNQADNRLMKTFFQGEKNKFDWSRFVSVHKRCHNDLEATGPALSEDDKVRRLLNGIHTPKLEMAILFVRSSPQLLSNFDAAVDSITTVVENTRESSKRPFHQISGLESGQHAHAGGCGRGGRGHRGGRGGRGGHGGRGRGGGRGNQEPWTEPITARWYQHHELARMSGEQRTKMRARRTERDATQGNRQIAGTGTVVNPPSYPPYVYPNTHYPPSVVDLPPPPPPMTIAGVSHGNRQNPALHGPRGQAPPGYPTSVAGSYGVPPLPGTYPGYPPYY